MKIIERNAGLSGSSRRLTSNGQAGGSHRSLTPVASSMLACLLLTACAGARYHNEGMSQIEEGKIDTGIASLKKATELEVGNQYYKIDYLTQRDKHADAFVRQADQVRASGDIPGARDLYGRALTLSPGNARAEAALKALDQDVRNDQLLVEGERYLKDGKLEAAGERAARVLADQPANKQAAQLRKAILDARAAAEIERDRLREAKSVMSSPVTLQFRDAAMRKVSGVSRMTSKPLRSSAETSLSLSMVLSMPDKYLRSLLVTRKERTVSSWYSDCLFAVAG